MQTVEATSMVQLLEKVRAYTPMFIGNYSPESLQHFLHGAEAVYQQLGFRLERGPNSVWYHVITEHGWTPFAGWPGEELKKAGLSDKAIVEEILAIEIEAWKRVYLDLHETHQAT